MAISIQHLGSEYSQQLLVWSLSHLALGLWVMTVGIGIGRAEMALYSYCPIPAIGHPFLLFSALETKIPLLRLRKYVRRRLPVQYCTLYTVYVPVSSLLIVVSVVVRSYEVRSCPPISCICRKFAVDKIKNTGPRAQEGSRATGIVRGTYPQAPQGREQRSTVLRTVLRTKISAPEPRIARAPELVVSKTSTLLLSAPKRTMLASS
jgi:hypothetical protein